jgi:hypothetical protein
MQIAESTAAGACNVVEHLLLSGGRTDGVKPSFSARASGSKLANARFHPGEEKEEDIVENKKQTASREQARKREACREVLSRAHEPSDWQLFPISPR